MQPFSIKKALSGEYAETARREIEQREEMFFNQAVELAAKGNLPGLIRLRKVYESTPDLGTLSPNTLIAIDKAIAETSTSLQKETKIYANIKQQLKTLEKAIENSGPDYSIGKSYQFQKGRAEFVQKLDSPLFKTCCGVEYQFNFAGVQIPCTKCGKIVTTN